MVKYNPVLPKPPIRIKNPSDQQATINTIYALPITTPRRTTWISKSQWNFICFRTYTKTHLFYVGFCFAHHHPTTCSLISSLIFLSETEDQVLLEALFIVARWISFLMVPLNIFLHCRTIGFLISCWSLSDCFDG